MSSSALVRTPCPRCQGTNLKLLERTFWKWIGFGLLGTVVLVLVGMLFPPLWIALPFVWVGSLVAAIFWRGRTWQCQDCRHDWKA